MILDLFSLKYIDLFDYLKKFKSIKKLMVLKRFRVLNNCVFKNWKKKQRERLRAQKRYSRKDTIIMLNPPYDARNVRDVTMETLKIFKNFLDITIKYEA